MVGRWGVWEGKDIMFYDWIMNLSIFCACICLLFFPTPLTAEPRTQSGFYSQFCHSGKDGLEWNPHFIPRILQRAGSEHHSTSEYLDQTRFFSPCWSPLWAPWLTAPFWDVRYFFSCMTYSCLSINDFQFAKEETSSSTHSHGDHDPANKVLDGKLR